MFGNTVADRDRWSSETHGDSNLCRAQSLDKEPVARKIRARCRHGLGKHKILSIDDR